MTSDPDEIQRGTDTTVYAQVAAILRRRIVSGQIAPRYPIPSRATTRQELGVSDISWQKAVRMLRDEGYVRVVRGLGTFVTDPSGWPDAPP